MRKITYIYGMIRSLVCLLFLFFAVSVFAQKHTPGLLLPKEPQDNPSMITPDIQTPFGHDNFSDLAPLKEYAPISKNNELKLLMPVQMPILYPELDAYGMPILKPSQDVAYSLLITPMNPPLPYMEKE